MEKKHIAFTICSKSYLAGALEWRRTLGSAGTGIRGLIYVIDAQVEELLNLCIEVASISKDHADSLENDLRCPSTEDIPDDKGMRERYNTIEYCTAIKPSIFLSLAKQFPDGVLHYFDPDIAIFGKLDKLKKYSEVHSITMTPHMTTPTDDNFKLSQLDILRAGVFNFGYLGWNTSFKSGWTLIKWWQGRLNKDCRVALAEGIFTDQSWGVFFCSSPDAGIFHEIEYNVAYWNLHERIIGWTDTTGYTCNGGKLQFFHFSGYSPLIPSKLSLHQNRHHLEGLRGLDRLCSEYSKQLKLAGFENWKKDYSDIKKDDSVVASTNTKHRTQKKLFKDCASQCIYSAFVDPNKSRLIIGITWWLIYFILKGSNWLSKTIKIRPRIYTKKADIYIINNYPDISLIKKGFIYWRFFLYIIIYNIFQKTYNSINLRSNNEMHITSVVLPLDKNEDNRTELSSVKGENEDNIAVIGYITAETGLGESVRGIIRSMDMANYATHLYDISGHYARSMDKEFSSRICDGSGPIPKYKTCLLHVNADQVPHILREMPGSLLKLAEYRIGYWYWETETLPHGQAAAANYFDELWVATEFVREALISSGVKIPVRVIPPALSALPEAPFDRSYFKLPEDRPICMSVFDATSFLGRKNPIAVIQSIKEIYDNEDDIKPLLVLKTTNLKDSNREELLRLASPVDLRIINKYLSREETLSLVGLADCFISLHRAEGLGLSLIDAMRLGTPLVSTDYSGPKDFANDDTALLVPWEYCQASWDDGPYYGSTWAEPNIKVAAQKIKKVIKRDEDVQKRTMRAKQKVEEHFSRKRISDLIEKALL
jgi:glycosyltransferase involved in cell wall biosynthesis